MANGTGKDSRETFAINKQRFLNQDVNPDKAPESNTGDLFLKTNRLHRITDKGLVVDIEDHGTSQGLLDDDHPQYALLAGRATGQILYGGINASDGLTLKSTSNATKGNVTINDVSNLVFGRYVYKYEFSAQTTDGSWVTVATFPLNEDRVYFFSVKTITRQTNGSNRGTALKMATMYRTGAGAAARQGASSNVHVKDSSAISVEISPSGNNCIIEIKGVAGHNYNWVLWVEYAESD